jgi:hypothetical protein
VGLYLESNVQPGQSVVSESAGYIGFYGRAKLYDFPGLTSRVSVRALRARPADQRDVADLVAALQPDWIVMRPWELEELRNRFPAIAANYEVERVFEIRGIPEAQLNVSGASGVTFGGMTEVDGDMKFTVLKQFRP